MPSACFVNEQLLESKANLELAKEKIISLEKDLENLKKQHAEELKSYQQNHAAELEFLKQGHAAELMTMEEECKKKIDLNKTKYWVNIALNFFYQLIVIVSLSLVCQYLWGGRDLSLLP